MLCVREWCLHPNRESGLTAVSFNFTFFKFGALSKKLTLPR